jgi:tetratricopeptide (TPR) repeat protein
LYLQEHGSRSAALPFLRRALAIDEAARGPMAARTLADVENLAPLLPAGDAEPLWKRVAGSGDPAQAARALAQLAELREAAGDRAGAAALYAQAVAKEEAASGRDGARVAARLNALALHLEPARAIPLLERALAIQRRVWGADHPETATTETNLAGMLLAAGRLADAERLGREALAGFEKTVGPQHPRTAAAASNLADVLRARGDRKGAEQLYRRALEIDTRAYGAGHPEALNDRRILAEFLQEKTARPR